MAEKVRGSELLKHRYSGKDLEELLEVGDRLDNVDLVQFFPIGVPVDPDGGTGTWKVGVDNLQDLINALLQQRHIPHIVINPIGVPVDQFLVGFRAGSAQARG